jgi:hypothetical protein
MDHVGSASPPHIRRRSRTIGGLLGQGSGYLKAPGKTRTHPEDDTTHISEHRGNRL